MESCLPDYFIYYINLTLVGGSFRFLPMLLRTLLPTALRHNREQEQRTFHYTVAVAAIPLQIVLKTEGTQADTKLTTQVQTTYPKGYPASLTSDVTRWFGI